MIHSTLFCWGGCELHDCLDFLSTKFITYDKKIPFPHRTIDFNLGNRRPRKISTSLHSLYSPPGDLAWRLYESLKPIERKLSINESILAQEILKFPYIDFWRKNVTSNDILILNFSMECLSKLLVKNECITITPPMVKKSGYPHRYKFQWLFDEYLTKVNYIVPFDERDNLNRTAELAKDFAKEVYKIFNDRVILVQTVPATFIKKNDLSIIKNDKVNCFEIPYYHRSKITASWDHSYLERNLINVAKIFRRSFPVDISFIDIGKENFFQDDDHRWGGAPFHYHKDTLEIMNHRISDEIEKIIQNLPKIILK